MRNVQLSCNVWYTNYNKQTSCSLQCVRRCVARECYFFSETDQRLVRKSAIYLHPSVCNREWYGMLSMSVSVTLIIVKRNPPKTFFSPLPHVFDSRDILPFLRDAGQTVQFRDCPAGCGTGGHPNYTFTHSHTFIQRWWRKPCKAPTCSPGAIRGSAASCSRTL